MRMVQETIDRLEQLTQPDRRLDAEITAWALAAPGWSLDPIEDLDGFGIDGPPDRDGETEVWMCAADVPYVTRYVDAAIELITAARMEDAASICSEALRTIATSGRGEAGEDLASRAARWLALALLNSLAESKVGSVAQAA